MEFKNLSAETSMAMSAAYIANHLSNELSNAIIEASECRKYASDLQTELSKTRAEVLEFKDGVRQLNNFSDIQNAKIRRLEKILEKHGIDIDTGEKLPFTK